MRNVLERRAELALMRALGFSRMNLGALVLSEHVWLLLLGLGAGVLSAIVAVAPAMQSTVAPVPWKMLAVSLAAVLLCGLFSAIAATWAMLRVPLMSALRNE
jgi:putative ABC transport system permease protein